MKRKNAMSELASRAEPTKYGNSSHSAARKGNYGNAMRRSARFLRSTAVFVAVLFICIVSAIIIAFSYGNKEEPLKADIILGNSVAAKDGEATQSAVAGIEKSSDKYKVSFTFYKKKPVLCTTTERTVGELIKLLDIKLDKNELLKTDLNAVITKNTDINVDNVSYGTDTEEFEIDYEIEYVDVEDIEKGNTVVHQEGCEGIKTVEYRVTYVNGIEKDREKTGEYVSKEPITMIVYRGVGGMVNVGGTYYSYSKCLDCKSTVYSGGVGTASGLPVSEDVIAVDPSVIPLGTRVYIEGIGFRTAADTGSSIIGNFIDIYYYKDNPAYWNYGVQYVKVYVLD